jgi:lysylphosphatidylglycerol synthetase-like protein (DUF2156 family)
MSEEIERPAIVTILAIINLILAFVMIVGGALLTVGLVALPEIGIPFMAIMGGITLILAILYLILGIGFIKAWRVSWYLAIIVGVIDIVLSLLSILSVVSIIPLAITIIILYFLFKPDVKAYFGI